MLYHQPLYDLAVWAAVTCAVGVVVVVDDVTAVSTMTVCTTMVSLRGAVA